MGRHPRGMFGEPAFARRPFTVLFGMPVLRHDVLGGQGDDLRPSGADDHRGDGGVIIEGLAIGELAGETVVAMDGLGRKVVGAIQGHQQLVAKVAKMRQHAVLFKALKDLKKHRIEMARGDRIEQRCGSDCHRESAPRPTGCGRYCGPWFVAGALVVQK